MKPTVSLLGIPFSAMTVAEAHRYLAQRLRQPDVAKIYTPNPQILWRASQSPSLSRLLRRADLLLPDGAGVILAAKRKGTPLPCRITGIDTAEWLLRYGAKRRLSFFFLGGTPGVARAAADRMRKRIPYLKVVGTHHGYFKKSGAENDRVLEKIRRAEPDVIFVCFGFPEQEKWIDRYTDSLPSVKLAMGLGGTLDVWAGKMKRAPKALQAMHLEWLWRTLCEPKRIKDLPCVFRFLRASTKKRYTP